MFIQVFFQGKSNELVQVFTKASADQKKIASDLLSRLDIANTSAYKELR